LSETIETPAIEPRPSLGITAMPSPAADRLVRLPLGHPKPELLVVFPKPGNGLGKNGSRGSGEAGNLQIPDDVVTLPIKLTLCVLDFGQNRVRSPGQQTACRRESYAAAVRLDESLPHVALAITVVAWASAFVVIRYAAHDISPPSASADCWWQAWPSVP
jgi:hypothetical protein